MTGSKLEVTRLLNQSAGGDQAALEELMPIVYDELRRMAKRYMRQQNPGHTLQTTDLVHEAYLRFSGNDGKHWENRAHFFGIAAKAMRHVLVDYARLGNAAKRGGRKAQVPIEEILVISEERLQEVEALDDALNALMQFHPRQGQVVELRYFGGLDVKEAAEVLHVSADTVMRDWRAAKAWLYRELNRPSQPVNVRDDG